VHGRIIHSLKSSSRTTNERRRDGTKKATQLYSANLSSPSTILETKSVLAGMGVELIRTSSAKAKSYRGENRGRTSGGAHSGTSRILSW